MKTQFLPLLGMLSFLLFGFVARAGLQYLRHGHTGIILFGASCWKQRGRDAMYVLWFVLLALQTLVVALRPDLLEPIGLGTPAPAISLLGAGLLFGGLALMVAAQLGMGVSWRVGIDETAKPGLVTGGLYQVCRNPIYLAIFIILAGLLMLVPTWLSLFGCVGVWHCIRSQTLREEIYLLQTYGEKYRTYAAQIGRFVPGIGKLSLLASQPS